jgi:geranylgeranyl diphosphate synthase type II
MLQLKEYTTFIEYHLKRVGIPETPSGLYDPIRYFLQIGGKRIRPILTILGAELFGTDKEKALSQALSVEVFHNFTLVHDDIMDNAHLRRNQKTIHHKWNINSAILCGDVMLIKAYELLCDIDSEKLSETLHLFNKTATEVCEGQQLDLDFELRDDIGFSQYIEMIRLKTSVLLGGALKIGAIIADASEKDKTEIYEFGQNIGLAFQIQDDILDLYADPVKFGKQIGGDVISNKKTFLHLTALSKATREQLEIIRQLKNETDIELKVGRTRELYDQIGVKEDCRKRMQEHYNIAIEALHRVTVPEENKKNLLELASYLMERDL